MKNMRSGVRSGRLCTAMHIVTAQLFNRHIENRECGLSSDVMRPKKNHEIADTIKIEHVTHQVVIWKITNIPSHSGIFFATKTYLFFERKITQSFIF